MLGFSYEFEVDSTYGKKLDNGSFNGMVKKLLEDVSYIYLNKYIVIKLHRNKWQSNTSGCFLCR